MKDKRPKNINPLTIRLPLTALVSIGHRISGIVVFLFIPLLLCGLGESLKSEAAFLDMRLWFQAAWVKVILWGFIAAFAFHFIAGLRHMLMDCHIGDSLKSGRVGAVMVLIATFVIAGLAAWCIGSVS
ncbi:succinate dehydrogenase, cytochrome b556 subunit [Candidatus Berkiella cookevillensis]|uniref:Succinate dehydrogenase cytochrome b556 subunit n=1 Tax=Candidatus Berkiella cookevillensis TaxID=437022 RepID=A0A0Q9YBK3_9GAMM|nr:succinate dehydrogenase, cytochrome b556 subunit [Candidatus Berkiella cookevillensis]MCS5709088.1 succinate dehydrogenase, cytochrome b556 subunit [Candidatus Berkiella cookevillensis]